MFLACPDAKFGRWPRARARASAAKAKERVGLLLQCSQTNSLSVFSQTVSGWLWRRSTAAAESRRGLPGGPGHLGRWPARQPRAEQSKQTKKEYEQGPHGLRRAIAICSICRPKLRLGQGIAEGRLRLSGSCCLLRFSRHPCWHRCLAGAAPGPVPAPVALPGLYPARGNGFQLKPVHFAGSTFLATASSAHAQRHTGFLEIWHWHRQRQD